MLLSEKGSFAPPPKLPSKAQEVSLALAGWKGVHARTHWQLGDESVVDGADFYLGDHEIGHIHLDGEAHVAVGPALGALLRAAKLAHRFRWSDAFVSWPIRSAAAVEHALWLFELRYDALSGRPVPELAQRIASHDRAT
jgi:hypothetical protein